MTDHSSATRSIASVIPRGRTGLVWGFVGVTAFSFTVVFTRIAVESLSPTFVGSGRAVIAAVLACIALATTRTSLPRGRQWARLAIVAAGVVIGFPLLTSFALETAEASHGAVVIALLPAATAVVAVIRTNERPPLLFWLLTLAGSAAALAFASIQGGVMSGVTGSDLLLFGAVVAAAIGYAEGGLLARELGAWQTISWALVLASPLMLALTVVSAVLEPPQASPAQWGAFGYLAVVSMFLGFFAWYHGLAIGPISRVSQVQLVQPVLSIIWAALIVNERLTAAIIAGGLTVVVFAGLAVRTRTGARRPSTRIVPEHHK